jgi:hypothetical protein
MDEQQWLSCTDPTPMLEFLRGKASDRKLRLFAVACCRRVSHMLTDNESRRAIEVAEMFSDGLVDARKRLAAYKAAMIASGRARLSDAPGNNEAASAAAEALTPKQGMVAWGAGRVCYYALEATYSWTYYKTATADRAAFDAGNKAKYAERVVQAGLVLDVFGNLFRPVTLDPGWLAWKGCTIPKLAQAIYNERAFDRLPVLADALEEAGCADPDILAHCRGPGPHVRGCWVVDAILGKT